MNVGTAVTGSGWFLNGLRDLQSRFDETQRQISSGFRVSSAADDPSATSALVSLEASLARVQDTQSNLDRVKLELDSADQAFSSGVSTVESIRTLAVQAGNFTRTAHDRLAIDIQVQGLQQQLVSLANTQVDGRYIFGGDQDQIAPYQLSAPSPSGVTAAGNGISSRIIADGQSIPLYQAPTARQIFDHQAAAGQPAPDNIFVAVQNLRTALQANDQQGIATALDALQQGSNYLNLQQSSIGTALQGVTQAQQSAQAQVTSLRINVSNIRATDMTQAAVDLAQEKTAQAATFGAEAGINRKSLFDYLG